MIRLADAQLRSAGPWTFFANPWGSSALPAGSYENSITIESDGDLARFFTSHRYGSFASGVRGYNAVQFGAGRGCRPLKASPARQVKTMGGIVQQFDYRVERRSGEFNVLAETFLVPSPTDDGKGSMEFSFQLYQNPSLWRFVKYGKGQAKGEFIDTAGVRWLVMLMPATESGPPYAMLIPNGQMLAGALPIGDALLWFVKRGLLTGDEWFRGWFFGVEPISGEATVHVDRLTGLGT